MTGSEPDLAPVDPADVMTLTGFFYATPHEVVRAYKKRGAIYVETTTPWQFAGSEPVAFKTLWRYDGIVNEQLRLTVVG